MNPKLEKIFESSYLKPVLRTKIRGHDIYIADGFVPEEQIDGFNSLHSVTIHKPSYATVCMVQTGPGRMFCTVTTCEADHDPEISIGSRQRARVNAALLLAEKELKRTKVH